MYYEGQFSNKEIKERGLKDMGYTYLDKSTNTYYSLFGNVITTNSENVQTTFLRELYQHIDDIIIKAYSTGEGEGRENFDLGLPVGHSYGFSYDGQSFSSKYGGDGGTIYRAITPQNSILHIRQMPPLEERNFGGYNNAPTWHGCFMILTNSKGFDAVQINFSKENAQKFRKAIVNILGNKQ